MRNLHLSWLILIFLSLHLWRYARKFWLWLLMAWSELFPNLSTRLSPWIMLTPFTPWNCSIIFVWNALLADVIPTGSLLYRNLCNALGRFKGSQLSCLVVQLAMPESASYVQFAKCYRFLICKPVYDGFQAGYLAVGVPCLMVWGLNIYGAFRCVFFRLHNCWPMSWVLPVSQLYCPSSFF